MDQFKKGTLHFATDDLVAQMEEALGHSAETLAELHKA